MNNFTPTFIQKEYIKKYLINAINLDGYSNFDGYNSKSTNKKLIALKSVVLAEAGSLDKLAVKQWLRGLPTCLDVAFYYSEIENILSYAQISFTENDDYSDMYFDLLTECLLTLLADDLLDLINKVNKL